MVKKKEIIKFDPEEVKSGLKGIRRQEEIDNQLRIPTHTVQKSKKEYTRKRKHKKNLEVE